MDRVRATITKNLEEHPEFTEYFKILAVIETHELINPDICIESCRSLIEGICKTIIIGLDASKNAENTGGHFPNLFARARQLLIDNCAGIEGDVVITKYGTIIELLNKLRNDRGDISHGRAAPKQKFSSTRLASMVKGMTDTVLTFMLEHYFELELSTLEKLDYEAKEMADYNAWLDDRAKFPIKTIAYSRILFEYDYDAYETQYWDEFFEEEEEAVTAPAISVAETPIEVPAETGAPAPAEEESAQPEPAAKDTPAETPPEGNIIPWTEEQEAALVALVDDMGLKLPYARRVVQQYLFDGLRPLSDTVVETLVERPRLLARREIAVATTERLLAFANHVKPEAAPGGGAGE